MLDKMIGSYDEPLHCPFDYYPSDEDMNVVEEIETDIENECLLQMDDSFRKFFLSEPVSPEEIASTSDSIYRKMDHVLTKLEKEGPEAYARYINDRLPEERSKSQKEIDDAEQPLNDAMIKGSPRDYQTALFEIAKTRNTIIHLGTGKGKTLIALLCIKHCTGKTLFLVPTITLALQQSNTLRANLSQTVKTACWNVAHTDKSRLELSQADVLVATHGAMHDLLMHYGDLFQLCNFKLVVFDECHYAHGNHQYKIIMDKWYKPLADDFKPRILGLTASPLINVKPTHSDEYLESMLNALEQTLDSRLAQVTGVDDLDNKSKNKKHATEKQIRYFPSSHPINFPSHDNLRIHGLRSRELNQLRVLYQELGPLVVSTYCQTVAKEISCNVYENETKEQFYCLLDHFGSIVAYCDSQVQLCSQGGRTDKLIKLEHLLQCEIEERNDAVGLVFVQRRITAMALLEYFNSREKAGGKQNGTMQLPMSPSPLYTQNQAIFPINDKHCVFPVLENQFDDPVDDLAYFSTKYPSTVTQVRQDVEEDQFADPDSSEDEGSLRRTESFQVPELIGDLEGQFNDAEEDNMAFIDINFPSNKIRCGALVRHATQIFKYMNASNRVSMETNKDEQRKEAWLHQEMKIEETLRALRTREINVLLATSMVEEGIDVQSCSFVAVFDSVATTKSYIQMKGRARHEAARFFLFVDGRDVNAAELSTLQMAEQRVKAFIGEREHVNISVIRISTSLGKPQLNPSLTAETRAVEEGEYKAKHGRVDLSSAKSLLNRYVLNIPMDSTTRAVKEAFVLCMPLFEEVKLVLPAHLPMDVRVVTLPNRYHHFPKAEKQQMLSLMACVRLHKLELLNDRLLPLQKTDLTRKAVSLAMDQVSSAKPYACNIKVLFESGKRQVFLYPIVLISENISIMKDIFTEEAHSIVLISCDRISVHVNYEANLDDLGDVKCELGTEIACFLDEGKWDVCASFFSVLFNARWRRKTEAEWFCPRNKKESQEVLPPYVVGLLDEQGQLDWDAMCRVISDSQRDPLEREARCQAYDETIPMKFPRLCNPIYSPFSSYVIYGPSSTNCSADFPGELEGVSTFQDYFQVKHSCSVSRSEKLYVAQRIWHQSSEHRGSTGDEPDNTARDYKLSTDIGAGARLCPGLVTVFLPCSLCREAILPDPFILLLSVVLPQFLFHMERRLTVQSFLQHCISHFPLLAMYLQKVPWLDLCMAMTAKSADVKVNYDHFEWVGDAMLKLLQSDAFLSTLELRCWVRHLHEGDLTNLRSAMSSNDHLAFICERVGFDKFVNFVPLAKGKWSPHQLESYLTELDDDFIQKKSRTRNKQRPRKKVRAGIMESLLGLVHVYFGYDAARKVGLECGLLLPHGTIRSHIGSIAAIPRPQLFALAAKLTGRENVLTPALVEEAFTHPSAIHEQVPSYQRLEWVGDAVLCVAVREWIFREFPHLSVGDMVTLEAALVSNEMLGYHGLKTDLHKFINHRDQTLPFRLENYELTISEIGRGIWGSEPPKILADVVEALFGAAHTDGGYIAGQLAVKTMMQPVFEVIRLLNGEARHVVHPITKLTEAGGRLLEVIVNREDEYIRRYGRDSRLWQGKDWREPRVDGTDSIGTVKSFGTNLISVVEPSSKSVRNRSCALAVAVLEKNPALAQRWKDAAAIVDRHYSSINNDSLGEEIRKDISGDED